MSTYTGGESHGVTVSCSPGPKVECGMVLLRQRLLGSVTLSKFLGSPFPHLQNEGFANTYCKGLSSANEIVHMNGYTVPSVW